MSVAKLATIQLDLGSSSFHHTSDFGAVTIRDDGDVPCS